LGPLTFRYGTHERSTLTRPLDDPAPFCRCTNAEARKRRFSGPPVDVVEPHDVVFAEVATGLHLDQLERDPARFGEAMHRADRDVDRLVLVHHAHLVADRDLGGAAHHHPVLGAMVMLLQRQLAAGHHDDALDLEALAAVDRFVMTPRTIHAA